MLSMKLTYNQLKLELDQSKLQHDKTNVLLRKALEQIILLKKEISDLRDQLNKNSNNSSKPPSSDQKANKKSKLNTSE